MNPKGTFRGSLESPRGNVCNIFTTADGTRKADGKWGSLKGKEKDGKRKNVRSKRWRKKVKETSRISIFPFRKSGWIVFWESSYIYIYMYTHCYFTTPSIFASSFPCPLVFQAYSCSKAHSLNYSLQYPMSFCIMCLIYRFLLFRTHLLKDFWGCKSMTEVFQLHHFV